MRVFCSFGSKRCTQTFLMTTHRPNTDAAAAAAADVDNRCRSPCCTRAVQCNVITQPPYLCDHICSASSWSQHTLFNLCPSHQTIFITEHHLSLFPTCFTSSLEPAIRPTSLRILFAVISHSLLIDLHLNIWFNMLHTPVAIIHFIFLSLENSG